MIKTNVFKLKHGLIIYIMLLFSSLVVFQFDNKSWFLYLQILFCIVMALSMKKVIFLPYPMINAIFLWMMVSALSGFIGNAVPSYKKAAIVMALFMVPMYFSISYCYSLIKKNPNYLTLMIKAFKAMCILHLAWIPLQYVMYYFADIDLNKLIFDEILNLTEKASFIRSWVYFPSGFTHHSAVLAPLFVIALFLFESLPIRVLIVVNSVICGNSTAMIGVIVAVSMMLIFRLVDKRRMKVKKIKLRTLIIAMFFIILFVYLFQRYSIANILNDRVLYTWRRLFGGESDASTSVHLQYFYDYFTVIKNGSLLQTIFGCGEGCSGYYISTLYNRYTDLGNWAIECDIVDIALCKGIIGFVIYYVFFFYVTFKGLKIDRRYFIVMVSILIQGFGYNVQWDYVLFIEIIFFITLKLGLNFFEMDTVMDSIKIHGKGQYKNEPFINYNTNL